MVASVPPRPGTRPPQSNANENNMPEVYTRTPQPQVDENGVVIRCEFADQQALYKAESDGKALFFCMHHARESAPSLVSKGWTVTPDNWATFGQAK